MSMIGRLNLELQEQAEELGFETVQEALDNGYEVDYEKRVLIDPQEAAHKMWLKDREHILKKIAHIKRYLYEMGAREDYQDEIFEIEAFIRRGEE